MSVNEFQEMMRALYWYRDSKRGITGTYEWLMDEVKELGEALEGGDREALAKEFADVFAWLASLANITAVDLEKAAFGKYANKCPKCQQRPCRCIF